MGKNFIEPELKELLPGFLIKHLDLENTEKIFHEEDCYYFYSNTEPFEVSSTEEIPSSAEFLFDSMPNAPPNLMNCFDHCAQSKIKPTVNTTPDTQLSLISPPNDNRLANFLKTKKGSRYFQEIILSNKDKPHFLYQLVENLGKDFASIMTDSYGNYLCKLIFPGSDAILRMKILNHIQQNFIEICCNIYGVHTMTILIINAPSKKEKALLMEMINTQEKVLKLCLDVNGCQIIQLLIELIEEKDREFLNNVLIEQFCQLAKDINGLYILKKLITSSPSESLKKKIIQKTSSKIIELSRNHLGHYLPLYIIESWGIESIFVKDLLKTIKRTCLKLAKYKHSSSIIEKLFEVLGNEEKYSLIKEILLNDRSSLLLETTQGTKVLRKAIIRLNPTQKRFTLTYLLNKLSEVCGQMKNINHNCQVQGIVKIIELFPAESWM